MYKNKDFDYDLWKDANGKCYARVRSTGEVCEISNDIFSAAIAQPSFVDKNI